MQSPLICQTLKGQITPEVPVWMMRQAGRYLPEYRQIRSEFSNFLEFCYTPDAATQVTLQPLRRFELDAAILFSDILVIPDALGQKVDFIKGEGPVLNAITDVKQIDAFLLDRIHEYLQPVFTAIKQIKSDLPANKALIGFSGAPWTLACYMIEGKGSRDFAVARQFALSQPVAFTNLMDLLVQSISDYLIEQISSGADIVQLFDSWAGVVPAHNVDDFIIQPTRRIVQNVKKVHPNISIIGFAKGIGIHLTDYAGKTGLDALGIDAQFSLSHAAQMRNGKVLQGNLDNLTLASSKSTALLQTQKILQEWSEIPFIFNLGHGIVPHTPIENVQAVVQRVKEFRRNV